MQGPLVLNFCNTVDERLGYEKGSYEIQGEELTSLYDVIRWFRENLGTPSNILEELKNQEAKREDLFLKWLHNTRESIFTLLSSFVKDHSLDKDSLSTINEIIEKLPSKQLKVQNKVLVYSYQATSLEPPNAKFYLIAPLFDNLTTLLTDDRYNLKRIRLCEGKDCSWLFYDTSKNGARRWCSMDDCGNREKVRNFFARKRK